MILFDTCLLSELKRPQPNQRVLYFIQSQQTEQLFLSSITIGELHKGYHLMPDGSKKSSVGIWIRKIENEFCDNLLPACAEVCKIWGELTAKAAIHGKTINTADGLIAATAIHHGLALATRNIKDFEHTGVQLINPWE